MKTKILTRISAIVVMAALLSFDLPKGWFKAGSNPESYEMGVVKIQGYDRAKDQKLIVEKYDLIAEQVSETKAATIKSIKKKIDGFGTLMQNSKPGNYLGNRVRMSGYMKTENVSGWAGFWFRVDGENESDCLSFDNMHDAKKNRSIKGTTGWAKYEIVLDVPARAANLAYGALLVGTGQIWFDNITFEIVDSNVLVTGPLNNEDEKEHREKYYNNEPLNLDFEK